MDCNSTLVVSLSSARQALPVSTATVTVTDNDGAIFGIMASDASGRTQPLCLAAPPAQLSLEPDSPELPYAVYNVFIEAAGFTPIEVLGVQLFDGRESILEIELEPAPVGQLLNTSTVYEIPVNTLRDPTRRRPEGPDPNTRILTEVYIPSYITVHLGAPDSPAQDVTVSFINYIKNVASSEIYPTWPENAIRANIYCQISFALNRVFTEWYTSRGYPFNITNNTNYDQAYVRGRNIFDNISEIVDEIFNVYIRRIGTLNPLFAEYCNGTTVTCSGLSQWGTVPYAQNGLAPLNILKRYYGNNIELISASTTRVIQSSYPGRALRIGSSSSYVETIERQLNRIRQNYPSIPLISSVDQNFTQETLNAVTAFQRIFNLTPDGIVGRATWNKISYIYTAVRRLAELGGESEPLRDTTPNTILRRGSRGNDVRLLQYYLKVISNYYDEIPPVSIDGIFGPITESAVRSFQQRFGLAVDGIVGKNTWNSLYDVFLGIANTSGINQVYPGYPLREGSRGANVYLMQEYLRALNDIANIPFIAADGIFGPATRNAVIAFQRAAGITVDGIIGKQTWDRIVAARRLI